MMKNTDSDESKNSITGREMIFRLPDECGFEQFSADLNWDLVLLAKDEAEKAPTPEKIEEKVVIPSVVTLTETKKVKRRKVVKKESITVFQDEPLGELKVSFSIKELKRGIKHKQISSRTNIDFEFLLKNNKIYRISLNCSEIFQVFFRIPEWPTHFFLR